MHTLTAWSLAPETVDIAELVVSELVTNAVKASRADDEFIVIQLSITSGDVTVEVWSPSEVTEPRVQHAAFDSETGRGLALVEALTSRWGAYLARNGGVVVRARFTAQVLPRPRPADDAPTATGRCSFMSRPTAVSTTPAIEFSTDPETLARVVERLRALDPRHDHLTPGFPRQSLTRVGSASGWRPDTDPEKYADAAVSGRADRPQAVVTTPSALATGPGASPLAGEPTVAPTGRAMTYQLIASPFLDHHLLVTPASTKAVMITPERYSELRGLAAANGEVPGWVTACARRRWDLEVAGPMGTAVLVREPTALNFGRATYELNLGCNYDCEHCYLGLRRFEGLGWDDRVRLLHIIRDAGVLWLQLTGGEPTIDRHFSDVYRLAYDLGMMVEILSNGSRLANPTVLELLTRRRPYRVTVSVYGATEATYDGLNRRRGAFRAFRSGLHAAYEAGIPLELSIIVTNRNAHELDAMRALAERYGLSHQTFRNISPTIHGGIETLAAQSPEHLGPRTPFTGCDAGHTFFHCDPFGMASICKVGRDPQISLLQEGTEGLARLAAIADGLLQRQGGCTGCSLHETCGTCMPLVTLFRRARAPLRNYCQHTEERRPSHASNPDRAAAR
ncbi:MAG: radical SAM protein [Frankia sp.]|nr:radical SAM protein [Frankia sp.]